MSKWILRKLLFRSWFAQSNGEKRGSISRFAGGTNLLTKANELNVENLARASAMLTHISLMIALTGILWALEEKGSVLVKAFGFELLAYISLATLCLYCLSSVSPIQLRNLPKETTNPADRALIESADLEVTMDRAYVSYLTLSFCRQALMWLTWVLALTVFVAVLNFDHTIENWVNSTLSK